MRMATVKSLNRKALKREGERGYVARFVRHSAGQLGLALKTNCEL
jgi:hypothetical protein